MDHRDTAHYRQELHTCTIWIETDDGEEEIQLPTKYDVCPTCEGRGKHVNPSIDAHGISPEEFYDDPDFEESYFRGDYDITCNECKGLRVIEVPDFDRCTDEQKRLWKEREESFYQDMRNREAEMRYGY